MKNTTQIVILAAGIGKRMKSPLPKALTPLGDKTMVDYVVETSLRFNEKKPIVVIGFQGEKVKEKLKDTCSYVTQDEAKGTGHAVMMAKDILLSDNTSDTIIVLYADQPYISVETLNKLTALKKEKNAKLVIATAVIEDDNLFKNQFYNFGRIVRDEKGTIIKIVEKKDANDDELSLREVNPAYFCLDKEWMLEKLDRLDNNNAQNEYYLTDLVHMAFEDGLKIESVQINEKEALGANTPEQLNVLESYLD